MNRKFVVPLFILALATNAMADQIDDLVNVLPSNEKTVAQALSSVIPFRQRAGLSNYIHLIGTSAAQRSNGAIAETNATLLKENPCFQDLASEFYASFLKDDLESEMKRGHSNGFGETIKLSETVDDFDKPAGWVWDRALQYAGGDHLLAMKLIGICGHDSVYQLAGTLPMTPKARELVPHPSDADFRKMYKTDFAKTGLPASSFEGYLRDGKRTWAASVRDSVACPDPNGPFYAPRALGADADIPDSLKTKIARLQAPHDGLKALPSKSYHVLGEAYASCELVQRGMPGFISERLVIGAVDAYRSGRLCEILSGSISDIDPKKSIAQLKSEARELRQHVADCWNVQKKQAGDRFDTYTRKTDSQQPIFCELASLLNPEELSDPNFKDEIIYSKLVGEIHRSDSIRLFQNDPVYKSSHKCQGPQLTHVVRQYLEKNGLEGSKNPCPADMPADRCQAARHTMDTYAVDFEWTGEQHLAGYKFAQKNCPPYNSENDFEKVACTLELKNPTTPPEKVKTINRRSVH